MQEERPLQPEANYLTATRSFTIAEGRLPLCRINQAVLADYQQWMREKGISANTASCYNRTLRAIYNKAVGRGLTKDNHPFKECYTEGQGRRKGPSTRTAYACCGKPTSARAVNCGSLATSSSSRFMPWACRLSTWRISGSRRSSRARSLTTATRRAARHGAALPRCLTHY